MPGRAAGTVRFDGVTLVAPDPRLSIGQATLGNVFTAGEPTTFPVATNGDRVAWTVRDHWGSTVATGERATRSGTLDLRLPVDEPGYYRLSVTAKEDGVPLAEAENTFAIVTDFDFDRVEDSSFGVVTHFGQRWSTELMPLIAKAGAKSVRDEAYWNEVELTQGEYGFNGKIDHYMRELAGSDINPLLIVDYTNPHYDNNSTPCTDTGRAGFANYADAVLDHYGDQIRWVEVYNEFNHPGFGDRGDCTADASAAAYAALIEATYDRIKQDHPETTVVGMGAAGVPVDWLETAFTTGAGLDPMDAVSVHPYHFPSPPELAGARFSSLDALIKEHNGGQPKPIWYTEIGWPTHTGSLSATSERDQAAYLVRSQVLALADGVQKYFLYDFMNDGPDLANLGRNYGLVRHTADPLGRWAPKPGYVSYSVLTRQLTGARHAGADDVGDGVRSHLFVKGLTETRVIWSTEPRTVEVETDRPVTVTDLVGRARTYWPRQGGVQLTVDGNPLYVTGDVDGVAVTERLSLTAAGDGVVALGEPVDLTLTVDNTAARKVVRGTFEIAGERVRVDVDHGERAEIPVTVAGTDRPGHRDLIGRLSTGLRPTARLAAGVEVKHPVSVSPQHVRSDGADSFTITATNHAGREIPATELDWSVGELSGTTAVAAIPAGGSRTVAIELDGLAAGTHPASISMPVDGAAEVTFTGTVVIKTSTERHGTPEQSITVDGAIDPALADLPEIDLLTDGVLSNPYHRGPDDHSGQTWFTWDDEALYVSARITDDVHVPSMSGNLTGTGDYLQFGVVAGLPGESTAFSEYKLGLIPDGPEGNRAVSPNGNLGYLPAADVHITRDEAAKETVYEVTVPWRELVGKLPPDVRPRVAAVADFWGPAEAAAVYARAFAVVSQECHSPILSVAAGRPAIYVRNPTDSVKGQMYPDLGLGDDLLEITETTGDELLRALLARHAGERAAVRRTEQARTAAMTRLSEMVAAVAAATGHESQVERTDRT